jgi:ribonuclease HII
MLPTTLPDFDENIVIAACDEVGRGTLCGPVAAAVVIWDKDYQPKTKDDEKCLNLIKDSKKLSAKNREKLAEFIKTNALDYAIATVDNNEIDKINILQATFKAMHLALDKLQTKFDRIVVDGNRFKPYIDKSGDFIPHTCIVKGDDSLFQIACASIIAKVYRDQEVTNIHMSDEKLHVYCWNKNKGYGTKEHLNAIKEHGITPYHRKTFIHI